MEKKRPRRTRVKRPISEENRVVKPKVAIACQGGGSQTAFTAGVAKALCENKKIRDNFNIEARLRQMG